MVELRVAGDRLVTWQWLGIAGSSLIALGGVFVGVGPAENTLQTRPGLLPMAAVYLGLTFLLLAWGGVGRSAAELPLRDLVRTGVLWAVPFAFSGPIFSRDMYSYLAQGVMTVGGLDPYRFGPSALGGELAVNIPPIWQDTPAPYGPVFLHLAGAVGTVTGEQLWPGLIGLRLLAVAGIALIAVAVHRIARDCGVEPGTALWLGVLNPLVVLHLVADAHNEAVMLGLLCAGLALRRRPWLAAVLITLAGLVKGPALLGLVFLAVPWAAQLTGRARLARAAGAITLTAAGTAVTVSLLTGTGFGWIAALGTPTRARTWLSITTDVGSLLGHALQGLGVGTVDTTRQAVWFAGLVAAGLVVLVLLRRSAATGMVAALGLGLAAVVMLGPVVHPWYLLWAVVPLAAAGSERARRVVVAATPALVLLWPPNGAAPGVAMVIGALLGIAAGLFAYGLLHRARRPLLSGALGLRGQLQVMSIWRSKTT